ncbi:hypothetical protein [Streptomyces sp. L2]|uniref:hypothetical protein n=1 Tax=Streptomyces sp. L2 TaxID=2162665 RepID=UPI001012ECD1|nr:hypothetical protein [Streptomyces sp. L2]
MSISSLGAPQLAEYWSLLEDVEVDLGTGPGGPLVLSRPGQRLHIDAPGKLLREAVRRMQLGAVTLRNVVPDFPEYDTPEAKPGTTARQLVADLQKLGGMTVRTLDAGGRPLLSFVPVRPDARLVPRPLDGVPGQSLRLVGTALRRPYGASLESAASRYRAQFHGPHALALLARLRHRDALPTTPVASAAVAYLHAAKFLLWDSKPQVKADSSNSTRQSAQLGWHSLGGVTSPLEEHMRGEL